MEAVCTGIETPSRISSLTNTFPRKRIIKPSRRVNVTRAVGTDPKLVNGSVSKTSKPINGASLRIGDVSQEIKRVRAQMEENEDLAIFMRGLRGQNLSDSQFADDSVQLKLVEVDESNDLLPMVYDPATISAYWGKDRRLLRRA